MNMNKFGLRISVMILLASIIVCLFVSSCSLDKRVSVTTGRYNNIPNRYIQPHTEIEISRDTIASYRF